VDRLPVLERLAASAPTDAERRATLGELARLADSVGETDRALGAWRSPLEDNPRYREAHDAPVAIPDREQHWQHLVVALRRRAEAGAPPHQRRADLARIAQLYVDELGAPERALEAWVEIREEFGDTAETIDALAELQHAAGRWRDLA